MIFSQRLSVVKCFDLIWIKLINFFLFVMIFCDGGKKQSRRICKTKDERRRRRVAPEIRENSTDSTVCLFIRWRHEFSIVLQTPSIEKKI